MRFKDLKKSSRSGDKEILTQIENYQSSNELSSGILGRNAPSFKKNPEAFKELSLITVKPCLYVGNIEDLNNENSLLEDLIQYGKDKNSVVLPMCNQLEAEIAELDTEEGKEFLEDMGLEEPGLNKLIRESYKMLSSSLTLQLERKKLELGQSKMDLLHLKPLESYILTFKKDL